MIGQYAGVRPPRFKQTKEKKMKYKYVITGRVFPMRRKNKLATLNNGQGAKYARKKNGENFCHENTRVKWKQYIIDALEEHNKSLPKKDQICTTGRMAWDHVSRFVRLRDKKCVKCGSTRNLEADHFHPNCYLWTSFFMRPSKIQTLCKVCHNRLPSMKKRACQWKNFVYYRAR